MSIHELNRAQLMQRLQERRTTQSHVAAVENINGQAITLDLKHKDKRDPRQWKGFKFAVPFEYSMHNFLLRYYLAEHGVDPDKDIQIRVLPPPEMVANLKAGNVDGFLAPDPFNQRAVFEQVGFVHLLSKEIWDGHPCCAFAISKAFAEENPNTFGALFKAIVDATHFSHDAKRWGYVKGDVDYKGIAERVYLAADCGKLMKELGYDVPASTYRKHVIMGKEFDPAAPDAYLASFAIRRT